MSEEQKALDDVLDGKPEEKKEEKPENAESAPEQKPETEEPAPEQQEAGEEKQDEAPAGEPAEEEKPAEETEEQEPAEEQEEKTDKKPEDLQQKKDTEEMKKDKPKPKKGLDDNVVLVGKKPTMSYVLAVVTQFSDGLEQIHIKARGRSISRAVDVAEVVRNRFIQDLNTDVKIGTQEVTDENNNKINVSTIDIILNK